MDFRIITKQVTSLSIPGTMHQIRSFGVISAICALLGTAVLAQTTSDFLDPLDQERVRIEQRGDAPLSSPAAREKPARPDASASEREANGLLTRARDGATSGAAAAQDRATGFWARMKGAVSDIAASLGLPTAGLLGLLGLLLAGLAALVGWTLFRGKRRSRKARRDVGVYARSKKSTERRQLGDANPLATSAAAEPEFQETEFEENMPEDFDTIFEEERSATPIPPKTKDASTWRKPNLDRLRNSIKADWKADKVRSGAETGALAPVTAAALAASTDPAERSLDDISDGWEDWDDQVKPEDDPWGETLTTGDDTAERDDAAIKRIQALRESLRAS